MNEDPWIIRNGELVPASVAAVSPFAEGFAYGIGAFETMRAANGVVENLVAHRQRLQHACHSLGLTPPPPEEILAQRIRRLVEATQQPRTAVKIIRFQNGANTEERIMAKPFPYRPSDYQQGFSLMTQLQGERLGRQTQLKTLNQLENIMARRLAQQAGADEVIFVTPQGVVLEGAISNLFCLHGEHVVTPPLSAGILPGTMRAQVLQELGARCQERPMQRDELRQADGIFLTNALMGVMPVRQIDDHPLGPFPVLIEKLVETFRFAT